MRSGRVFCRQHHCAAVDIVLGAQMKDPYGWHGRPLVEHEPIWPTVLAFVIGVLIMTGVPAP